MAKATITKELKEVTATVEEDVYTLRLTRDEAIAIYSLTGKVARDTETLRGPDLGKAAGLVYTALSNTGKFNLNDSMKVRSVDDGFGDTTLFITGNPVRHSFTGFEARVTAPETDDLLRSYGWTMDLLGPFGTIFWSPPKDLRKAGFIAPRRTDDAIRLEGWRGHHEPKGA